MTSASTAVRKRASPSKAPRTAVALRDDLPPVAFDAALIEAQKLKQRGALVAQEGPQSQFVNSTADICVYGGAAFAGKTYGELLQPVLPDPFLKGSTLRLCDTPGFAAVIFRRDTTQIRNPGAMWDESVVMYRVFGAHSVTGPLEHTFSGGQVVKFAHLEHENSKYAWDGAQVPHLGFDQLEHFTETQFFYMLSRNRDPSGRVRPRVRATCNPETDSWLARFLAWWIGEDGFPIPERAGKVRWYVRLDDVLHWADTREALVKQFYIAELPADHRDQPQPKSVQFIPGKITDNALGMKKDPTYYATLRAMPRVERERLLGGNWKVRPSAGLMFNRDWCPVVEFAAPDTQWVRYWDLAATKPSAENPDPDWTVGLKLGFSYQRNKYILARVQRMRETAGTVRIRMRTTAEGDTEECRVGFPQDPAQAGKDQAQQLVKHMEGFNASARIESGDKVVRFSSFSSQAEHGNVERLADLGADGEDFLRALENFPDGTHKDDADACSGAFAMFQEGRGMGVFYYYKELYERQQRLARGEALPADGVLTGRADLTANPLNAAQGAPTTQRLGWPSGPAVPPPTGPGGRPAGGYGKAFGRS